MRLIFIIKYYPFFIYCERNMMRLEFKSDSQWQKDNGKGKH
jgi:hypothetical protein